MPDELEDFHDPGMHVTWLVSNTQAFFLNPGPTSEHDRILHFGLKYREWLALYFDVLGVDTKGFDNFFTEDPSNAQHTFIDKFDQDIVGYAMLSRINGVLCDAVFEKDEVEELRQECLRAKAGATNLEALKGVDKLLRICDWALKLDLSIYLIVQLNCHAKLILVYRQPATRRVIADCQRKQ